MARLLLLPCLLLLIQGTQGSNHFVDMHLRGEGQELLPVPELFQRDSHPDHSSGADLYAFKDWPQAGNTYPRPSGSTTERNNCNTNVAQLEDASFCDAEGVLNGSARIDLNNKIKDAVAAQYCHCSPCNNSPRANGRYSINIAIAGYIGNTADNKTPPDCAEVRTPTFANNLKSSRWSNHEKCSEGVWVVYNPANKFIDTQTSSRANSRLTKSCLKTINDKLKQYLDTDQHVELLDNLVDYYKHALRGGKCGAKSGLTQDEVIAITCGIIFGVGGLIFIIMLCVGFFRNWGCIKETCLGMIVGAILRAIQVAINILIIKCMNAICEKLSNAIPACEEPCACCKCEPLTCVEDVESGGGGGGGW